MKTLSEKEFNGLNIKAMFTEKVEQAKKELSPLMQEVRKYIPQAEYGYHVVSGEYPAFYGVRIEFTYSSISGITYISANFHFTAEAETSSSIYACK